MKEYEVKITLMIRVKANNNEEVLKILDENPLDFKRRSNDVWVSTENQEIIGVVK